MSLSSVNARAVNTASVVVVVMLVAGFLLAGQNPSETERHLIFWPTLLVGIWIVMVLVHRDAESARGVEKSGVKPPRS